MNKKRLSSISNHKKPLKVRDIQKRPKASELNSSNTHEDFQPSARKPPVINVVKTKKRPYLKKGSYLRPILLASGSAALIGVILGFFILNMFTQLGDPSQVASTQIDRIEVANDTKDEQVNHSNTLQITEANTMTTTIEPFTAFVLQAGLFSTKENAETWATTYKENGYATVIWERDQQYFLFSGFAQSKGEATELANELETDQLEVFVKEWTTAEMTIDMTEANIEWLNDLKFLWHDLIITAATDISIDTKRWQQLHATIPDHHHLVPFKHILNRQIGNKEQLNQSDMQQLILSIWQALAQLNEE